MIKSKVKLIELDIEGAQPKLFENIAQEYQRIAREQAPYKTGELHDGIITEHTEYTATIRSTAPYSNAIEYGTLPHHIAPVNAKALSWVLPNGQRVFAKGVDHPGTRANPFMRRAIDEFLATYNFTGAFMKYAT